MTTSRDPQPPAEAVTVRYWAAAREAAGTSEESRPPGSVRDILAGAAADHPGLDQVLAVASTLLDGVASGLDDPAPGGSILEVLPPFAGG
ncbi:MAG: MoaD/ThiS family protein [Dermatophilaceae bacterium]